MTRTARDERTLREVLLYLTRKHAFDSRTTKVNAIIEALGCDPDAPLDLLFSHARAEGAREERERIVALVDELGRTHMGTNNSGIVRRAIESGAHRETDQ